MFFGRIIRFVRPGVFVRHYYMVLCVVVRVNHTLHYMFHYHWKIEQSILKYNTFLGVLAVQLVLCLVTCTV